MPLLAPEPIAFPDDLLERSAHGLLDGNRWRVLHTRPRAEKSLARQLNERNISYFLPTYLREWRNRGRTFRSYLPLFSGYVFLFGDHLSRSAATETNLVAMVLEVADQEKLQSDLSRVYRLITTGEPVTPEQRLEPGDPVRIVKGSLAGMTGKVIRRGTRLRFFVEVEMLRRAVSAEVESWMIESLAGDQLPSLDVSANAAKIGAR